MTNQAPGTEQRPKTSNTEGNNAPGSQDRKSGQMDQAGKQPSQPGGTQGQGKPHDGDQASKQDKDGNRGQNR